MGSSLEGRLYTALFIKGTPERFFALLADQATITTQAPDGTIHTITREVAATYPGFLHSLVRSDVSMTGGLLRVIAHVDHRNVEFTQTFQVENSKITGIAFTEQYVDKAEYESLSESD
jgi:hypothetical protein